MKYKVGDIVEVKINEEKYKVRITFIYEMNGLIKHNLYDGVILSNKYAITFNEFDILKEEVEGKKYLKTWEAIKALEEGKEGLTARRLDWLTMECGPENYMYMNNGKLAINGMIGSNHILNDMDEAKWIIEEPKKEIPKEFEGLKYILGSINNMDCDDKDCDLCPLGIDNCNKLDEVFFDIKEKYNF